VFTEIQEWGDWKLGLGVAYDGTGIKRSAPPSYRGARRARWQEIPRNRGRFRWSRVQAGHGLRLKKPADRWGHRVCGREERGPSVSETKREGGGCACGEGSWAAICWLGRWEVGWGENWLGQKATRPRAGLVFFFLFQNLFKYYFECKIISSQRQSTQTEICFSMNAQSSLLIL
jgi:hypothetical protein